MSGLGALPRMTLVAWRLVDRSESGVSMFMACGPFGFARTVCGLSRVVTSGRRAVAHARTSKNPDEASSDTTATIRGRKDANRPALRRSQRASGEVRDHPRIRQRPAPNIATAPPQVRAADGGPGPWPPALAGLHLIFIIVATEIRRGNRASTSQHGGRPGGLWPDCCSDHYPAVALRFLGGQIPEAGPKPDQG